MMGGREERSIYRQEVVSGYANGNRSDDGKKVKIESDKALRWWWGVVCGLVKSVFKCRQTRQGMSESNFWAGRARQGQVGGVEDGS